MNLNLSTVILSFALFLGGLVDQETDIIKEIDRIYLVAKSKPDLYKLEKLIRKSIKIFPQSGEFFWRLGRTYFKLGEKSNSESEKIHYFLLCIEQTKKAIKKNPKLAHGYFFNGLCNGSLGQAQGILGSLGKIQPFKKDMETAISLDPAVNEGGPHRALANLYLKLPYILGGNLNRSIRHFQQAIRFGPWFGENYLGLAEAYIKNGSYFLARETLQILFDIKPGSRQGEQMFEWHAEARKLLKQIPK